VTAYRQFLFGSLPGPFRPSRRVIWRIGNPILEHADEDVVNSYRTIPVRLV
jgi:hypothetical protein